MDLVDKFINKAKEDPKRIVYPEGNDLRIIAAAFQVKKMGIAEPVILGDENEIRTMAGDNDVAVDGITIISSRTDEKAEKYALEYAEKRDIKTTIAEKLVKKPLAFGGMMVYSGDADGMVAGVGSATASVIQAASVTIGFQKGLSTPSSFFIMILPEFAGEKNKIFIFADSAVNISPDAHQLAEIGVASGRNARKLLGIEPKIAFLSFATKGSARHADTEKVIEAVRIAKEIDPELECDGEFQADAAIIPRVAEKKVKKSTVAGKANVLVFPDLDAGNISYKLVQYMANAKALGPILQGFAKPVNDMSRGATVEDIVNVSAITVVQAQGTA